MITTEKNRMVTFKEVEEALGGVNPFESNSGELRRILGHGSNTTIQKHLNTLREKVSNALVLDGSNDVPPVPSDALGSLWVSAYNIAKSSVLVRLEKISAERDALSSLSNAQSHDIVSFAAEVDTLLERITTLQDLTAQTAIEVEERFARQKSDVDQVYSELSAIKTELTRVTSESAAAAQMAAHNQAIVENALQRTIDGLTSQVGNLKTMLFQREQNKSFENTLNSPECDVQLG